jgi:hypothetical protein
VALGRAGESWGKLERRKGLGDIQITDAGQESGANEAYTSTCKTASLSQRAAFSHLDSHASMRCQKQ